MAQASSAQREPSMEEILASIRRIIEDSEPMQRPGNGNQPSTSSGRNDEVDERVLEPANSDIVSFLRPADIGSSEPSDPAGKDEDEQPDHAAPEHGHRLEEVISDEVASPVEDAEVELPDDFAAELTELQAAFGEKRPSDEAVISRSFDAETHLDPASQAPLLSDVTGRQVAAAFGELSDAFAASRRRSFDEMAEQMLRPMLQDWLDDNLPSLVERLVREEIERVARGETR